MLEKVSVIIPTYNEASVLPRLLEQLANQREIELEVLIADANSTDETADIVNRYAATLVKTNLAGRGLQMNKAASIASGSYLYFLHADSYIEDQHFIKRAIDCLSKSIIEHKTKNIAGHHAIKFMHSSNAKSAAYAYYEAKTLLSRTETINGDQGLLIHREYFRSLNGYWEILPFLEDQEIAKRIFKEGTWLLLPGRLGTSARRFEEEGMCRRMVMSAIIMALYYCEHWDFFSITKGLYRTQNETGLLEMTPFLNAVQNTLKAVPQPRRYFLWLAIGRYVRMNAWQIFFFIDHKYRRNRTGKEGSFLKTYDRVISKLMDCFLFDFIGMILTYIWFQTIRVRYWYSPRR